MKRKDKCKMQKDQLKLYTKNRKKVLAVDNYFNYRIIKNCVKII